MAPVSTTTPAPSAEEFAERAIALGSTRDRNGAVSELLHLAQDDAAALEAARAILVGRLQLRSDDHAATAGLTVLNAAIAAAGWQDPVAWKPKRWFLPRRLAPRGVSGPQK